MMVYFQNRNLFADDFLRGRLRENLAWRDRPDECFTAVRDLLRDARASGQALGKQALRAQFYEPIFRRLGFLPVASRPGESDLAQPDYRLKDPGGKTLTAAIVFPWERWLDGPDCDDGRPPDQSPLP